MQKSKCIEVNHWSLHVGHSTAHCPSLLLDMRCVNFVIFILVGIGLKIMPCEKDESHDIHVRTLHLLIILLFVYLTSLFSMALESE